MTIKMDITPCPDEYFASYKELIDFIKDKFNLTLKMDDNAQYNGYPQGFFTGNESDIENYLNYNHITFGEVEIIN